jgi:hypothetical protein
MFIAVTHASAALSVVQSEQESVYELATHTEQGIHYLPRTTLRSHSLSQTQPTVFSRQKLASYFKLCALFSQGFPFVL